MGRGLEERRLPRHLAPELAAGGEVNIPQHDPRLCGLIFLKTRRLAKSKGYMYLELFYSEQE